MKAATWAIIIILAAALVAVVIYFNKKISNIPASNAQIQGNLQSLTDAFANSPYQSSASNPFGGGQSSPSPYF